MVIVAIVLAAVAVVLSIIAIMKSGKVVETKVTTKIEHAPVEHPFIYDEERKAYTLDGNFYATGSITCKEMEA
jgi:archaellin